MAALGTAASSAAQSRTARRTVNDIHPMVTVISIRRIMTTSNTSPRLRLCAAAAAVTSAVSASRVRSDVAHIARGDGDGRGGACHRGGPLSVRYVIRHRRPADVSPSNRPQITEAHLHGRLRLDARQARSVVAATLAPPSAIPRRTPRSRSEYRYVTGHRHRRRRRRRLLLVAADHTRAQRVRHAPCGRVVFQTGRFRRGTANFWSYRVCVPVKDTVGVAPVT